MAKEIWTLRKLDLDQEEVERLKNNPVIIYNSKFWNIVGIILFPSFTIAFLRMDPVLEFNIGTVLPAILLIVLGFNFAVSLQQIVSNKPALELTSQVIIVNGIEISWDEVTDMKFMTSNTNWNPTLKVYQGQFKEHTLTLGYLSEPPKDIHTLICRYYSIAKNDITPS